MNIRHILLAFLVVAIWGFNFVVIKITVLEMPPYLAAAIRFFFAAVPAVLFIKPPKNEFGKIPWWLIIGFGLTFGFGLYAYLNLALFVGLPAGLGSLILQVQAFFTMVMAYFILKERQRIAQIIGAVVAFSGIAIIGYYRWEAASLFPFILAILAAISWAFANILTKLAGKVNPLSLTVWGSLFAIIPLYIMSFIFEGADKLVKFIMEPDLFLYIMLLFSAFPATLLGLALWSWLLSKYPTSTVAPFSLLVPITALIFGQILLGETIAFLEIIGGILVIIGLGITVLKIKQR